MRLLLAVLFLVLLTACGPKVEAVTADAVAHMTNAAMTTLGEKMQDEGLQAINDSQTVDELMTAIPRTQDRWRPLWEALASFAKVHDAWATALENGQDGDVAAVQAAWCELRALSDEYGVCLADFPVLFCGP